MNYFISRSNLTRDPPETVMSGEDLRQVVGEDAMTSLHSSWSYRHDCGMPRLRLR